MSTETTGQHAPKTFQVTLNGHFTAEELQADLNEWLKLHKSPAISPDVAEAQVKQVLDAGYIRQDEGDKAIELLNAYVNAALPYQDPLRLLYDLATNYGDSACDDLGDGFWDWQAYIKGLVRFFLKPEHAAAYKEMEGGDLSKVLPDLLQFFTDLASSIHVDAALETVHYRERGLTVKQKHHNRVMKLYNSKLQAHQTEQAAIREAA